MYQGTHTHIHVQTRTHTHAHIVCSFRFNFIHRRTQCVRAKGKKIKSGIECRVPIFRALYIRFAGLYVCVLAHYGLAQSMSLSISIFLASSVHVMFTNIIALFPFYYHLFLLLAFSCVFAHFVPHQHELMIVQLNWSSSNKRNLCTRQLCVFFSVCIPFSFYFQSNSAKFNDNSNCDVKKCMQISDSQTNWFIQFINAADQKKISKTKIENEAQFSPGSTIFPDKIGSALFLFFFLVLLFLFSSFDQ